MKRRFVSIVAIFILTFCISAEVPQLVNYQGKIIDDNGLPINSTVNITFRIYSSETLGDIVWQETQNVVITDGVFNVLLGSVTAFSDTLFNEIERYLTIQIQGEDEIADRSRLVSTPYTINAAKLNGKDDEEIIFPYNIKFMVSTFYMQNTSGQGIVYILTANGDFFRFQSNSQNWEQLTSPPVLAKDIIFMDATTIPNNGNFEWSHVYILTKDGSFYKYMYPGSWGQQTNSPVSP